MKQTRANKIIEQRLTNPDKPLLKKILETEWTAHNIPLTRQLSTLDKEKKPLIEADVRTITIKKMLYRFMAHEDSLRGLKLLDLGCLEGGISFEMAREDMEVTGIEGRKSNFEKCQLIKRYFSLPNLDFLHLDVKKLDAGIVGKADVILCLGLLYHLDDPVSFLETLNDITHEKSLLFLDTHIAPEEAEDVRSCIFADRLSPLAEIEHREIKYEGRWYNESLDDEEPLSDPWAAVSNIKSFWLTRDALIRALYNSGFQKVFILYGCFPIDEEFELRKQYSRLWCIAVKNSFFASL